MAKEDTTKKRTYVDETTVFDFQTPQPLYGPNIPLCPIIAVQDARGVHEHRIQQKVFTIGRDPKSSLLLPDRGVSRGHALIRYKNRDRVDL